MGFSKTIFITAVIIVLGGAGWFTYKFLETYSAPTTAATNPDSSAFPFTPKVFPSPAPGMALYQSQLFRFRLLYPLDLKVVEYNEGRGTSIVFEDADAGEGFQIFVVPYDGQQISDERFKLDIPSGVMLEPTEVTVDDVRAQAFFSEDRVLGETREIWFLHNGFLYEVTTHKSLDAWLSGIMSTWHFF